MGAADGRRHHDNRANLDLVYRFLLLQHPGGDGSGTGAANSPRGYSAPRLRTRLDEFATFLLFWCWVYVLRDDLPPVYRRRLQMGGGVFLALLFLFCCWMVGFSIAEWFYCLAVGIGVPSCLRIFLSFFGLERKRQSQVSVLLAVFVYFFAFPHFWPETTAKTASFWIWAFLLSTAVASRFLRRGDVELR